MSTSTKGDWIWKVFGRSDWRYGRYCGACWGDDSGTVRPIDDFDRACQKHDACYEGATKAWWPSLARRGCDAKLLLELMRHGGPIATPKKLLASQHYRPRTVEDMQKNPLYAHCVQAGTVPPPKVHDDGRPAGAPARVSYAARMPLGRAGGEAGTSRGYGATAYRAGDAEAGDQEEEPGGEEEAGAGELGEAAPPHADGEAGGPGDLPPLAEPPDPHAPLPLL
eukprot:tig00000880_g5168.t1